MPAADIWIESCKEGKEEGKGFHIEDILEAVFFLLIENCLHHH